MDTEPVRLAILYNHPILGEGIARMLDVEPGLEIAYVESTDRARVEATVAQRPDMVVVERSCGMDALEILRQTPDTLVIEVCIGKGPTWVYRRQELPGDPQAVLGLIRRLRGGHPSVAVEPTGAIDPSGGIEPAESVPLESVPAVTKRPLAVAATR